MLCGYFVFLFQDFDNDGWQELLVTADYGSSKMFWNTKRHNFSECTELCGLDAKQVRLAYCPRLIDAKMAGDNFNRSLLRTNKSHSMGNNDLNII